MRRAIALCLLACLLLSGCAGAAAPATYSVTFTINGQLIQTQTVTHGQTPVPPQLPQDLTVDGWLLEGAACDPFTTAVDKPLDFTAQGYPLLQAHTPFLFPDEQGYLLPDEPLTGQALAQALEAMGTAASRDHFPALPQGQDPVTEAQLVELLAHFFPLEQVTQTFSGQATSLSRSLFAQGILQLLDCDLQSPVVLGAGEQIPPDVTADRTDVPALLAAALRHIHDDQGEVWSHMELPVKYEPGYLLLEGRLYYVGEDHRFLRDQTLGLLHFGPDGRYTSGDQELDQMTADILVALSEDGTTDRFALLRKAYDHCHSQYKYLRKEAYATGATGWEIEDAKEMFSSGRGNCYNFAAIFWALARNLGYDARAVSGTCTGSDQPHGWVIIEIDGADYFFDPEWQYAYTEREVFDKDMFMLAMDEVWYWTYKWVE